MDSLWSMGRVLHLIMEIKRACAWIGTYFFCLQCSDGIVYPGVETVRDETIDIEPHALSHERIENKSATPA